MQWAEAEPILRRTYALMETSGMTSGETVIHDMGLSDDDGRRAFEALETTGYIEVDGWSAAGPPFIVKPTTLGLQYCSGWPAPGGASTFVADFLSAINERANDSATPEEERGRLRKFLGAAHDAGESLLADVAAKLIEHQAGL
jgi:hypothetical protein